MSLAIGLDIGVTRRNSISAPFSSIAADGWQATVASPSDLSMTPVTVSRQGFDATGASTTHNDTLYLTKRVRQAYPNQASFTTDQVALSDYVYSTDTIAGATNNSTEASPKPVAAWTLTDRRVVGNSITVECTAFHRNGRVGKPVACVVFRATDGTTTVTSTVASMVVSPETFDECPVLVYRTTLDISSLSDNANITVNAKVYPWIGGAASVLDSADLSAQREFSPRTYRKNTSRAASPYYVYVKSTGDDANGAVSTTAATAEASPCLTPNGALNRARTVLGTSAGSLDGLVVRLDEGTWARTASATGNTVNAEVLFEPIPGVDKAACIFQFGAANNSFNLTYFRMRGLTIQRAGANSNNGTITTYEDCTVDFNANTTTPIAIAGTVVNYVGVDFGATYMAIQGNANTVHALFRGCTGGGANATDQREYYVSVGCHWTGGRMTVVSGRTQSGTVIAFNKFTKVGSGSGGVLVLSNPDVVGAAWVQNLIEWTSASTHYTFGVTPDGNSANVSHVILWHNTLAGANLAGRCNLFYDEGATARTSNLQSCKGNIHVQINTKSDVFRGINESGGDASTRTGNFAYEHGVGCDGEFSQYIDANNGGEGSFKQEYAGLNASIGTSNSVRNDPLFTSYAGTTYNGSTYTAGAGAGTYTLQGGSPCLGQLPDAVIPFNLAGDARPTTDTNSGAY